MTPATVIAEVRRLVQDERVPYRYSDAVLLGYVNQTLKRISTIRPDLFSVIGNIPTTEGSVVQTLPDSAVRLVDVFSVVGGGAIMEVNREDMSRAHPDWVNAAAGTPVNYMRHVKNPRQFFLYPPPAAGVELFGEYAYAPADYTLSQEIDVLPDAYMPVLVDGTVFLAESIDDEHVQSGRAKLFYDSFVQQLSVNLQSRKVSDTHRAGMDKGEVI